MPPAWVTALPTVNAGLNGLATLLLLFGYIEIRRGHRETHKRLMLTAFGTSVAFLACYLTYHIGLQIYTGESSKRFTGTGTIRLVYFAILISHVLLAAAVPVLAGLTIFRAWRQDWSRHRQIARITFPIWLYVSVTGVVIYVMLYHL